MLCSILYNETDIRSDLLLYKTSGRFVSQYHECLSVYYGGQYSPHICAGCVSS